MNPGPLHLLRCLTSLLLISLLTACGGGGGGGDDDEIGGFGGSVSLDKRISAARATASNNNACTAIEPFYWEIGDRNNLVAGESEGAGTPTAFTDLNIASASKWLFGAYVLERRGGVLTEADIKALTMKTGFTNMRYRLCVKVSGQEQDGLSVEECFQEAEGGSANNDYDAADDGKFFYNGGHFQYWAVQNGLDEMVNDDLAIEYSLQFNSALVLDFSSPQLAGGIRMNANAYAYFLRSILSGDLYIGSRLGDEAVCTNVSACPDTATYTPIPDDEAWHYSLGHWVEDDPVVGDGAFSSPGYFGFYPWIDAGRKWYGIVARGVEPDTLADVLSNTTAIESVECGRLIRKAWLSGQQQN